MEPMHEPVESFRGQFRFLSNFHAGHPFEYNGARYLTAEHAYQAAKCASGADAERVRSTDTPGQAKRLGRKVKMREDWDEVKTEIMADILAAKFADAELRERLLATRHAPLIEGNTWGDTYWGVCNGVGQNRLGALLMQLRGQIMRENIEARESQQPGF